MSVMQRFFIACLGALTPIITNLLVVDLNTTLNNLHVIDGITYSIRLIALCLAACIVVFLDSDESRPAKLFQLGIMAPALLTSLINGAAISIRANTQAPASVASAPPQKMGFSLLTAPAYAESMPKAAPPASSPLTISSKNCLVPAELSTTQQVLKGLIGLVPDNKWYIVVGSYGAVEGAAQDAANIRSRYGNKYQVSVCTPLGGLDKQFRVVIGENLTYADGSRIKLDAIRDGLPDSTWLWNPVDAARAIQNQ